MTYRVILSPETLQNLEEIRDWIVAESTSLETSVRFLVGLLDKCGSLNTFPERFRPYPFAPDWRMMPHRNYLIFFQIVGDEVRVGQVRHAARTPFRG